MSLTTPSSLTNNERRLITLFRQFVERAILPAIRTNDSAMSEWQYFSTLLSGDSIDVGKLQIYVDVLGGGRTYEEKKEEDKPKVGAFYRKKDEVGVATTSNYEPQVSTNEPTQPVFSFNPSKTFGGERSKLGIFPLKRAEDFTVPSVGVASKAIQQPTQISKPSQSPLEMDYGRKEERRPNLQKFIGGMEILHKQFQQNQLKMQQTGGLSSTNAPSYQPYKFDDKKYI